MEKTNYQIIFKRFIGFFIDLMTIGFIGGVISIIDDKFVQLPNFISDNLFYLLIILFMLRDVIFKDGSIGKKIISLKIINVTRDNDSFFLKKILRNITTIIWPIEAIILSFWGYRLSDKVLNLTVMLRE